MAGKQTTAAPPPDAATTKKQERAVKLARGVRDRHVRMIASEYRKAVRAAKKGVEPGDPTFMKEPFGKDLLRDMVQVACTVAGIPVPDVQV